MDSNSDNALMLKVKSGDLDKLGLLFERYHRRLFGYFYRLTRRRDLSEDLVQGVFERIIKYRYTYENSGAFSTWIYQIARNLHMDHLRKQNNGQERDEQIGIDEIQAHGNEYGPMPGFKETPDDEIRMHLLKKALDRVDPKKKESLVLSRFEGFTHKEIAEITGDTESAIKVRVFRALNEIREIITELQKEETHD